MITQGYEFEQEDQVKLPGLHWENRHKQTDKPTAERLLKAFDKR